MPVQKESVDYLCAYPKWNKLRAMLNGEDAVKQLGEVFLPKLSGQDSDDYANYVGRAVFFNATGRTVDSFVGMIFRKDPTIEAPTVLDAFKEDVTLEGQSLYDYQKSIVREVVGVGRSGSLMDWSAEENRPYITNYQAEQIINWRRQRISGKIVLSMVVLKERVDAAEGARLALTGQPADQTTSSEPTNPTPPPGVVNTTAYTGTAEETRDKSDEYTPTIMDQIRVLRLTFNPNNTNPDAQPIYAVEIWHKPDPKKDEYVLINTIYPNRKGIYLNAIPFVFHNPNNLLPNIDKSPMEDIAAINASHYRTSADLEHGRHFVGLPTPFISGVEAKDPIKLGADKAITATDPNARASFLEFKGEGLKALENALEHKEHQMAVLGARMLETPKKAAETVEVMQMKQTGEQASLAQIAATLSEGFEQLLCWALWWMGAADLPYESTKEEITVELNTDFNPTTIDPQLILAIVAAVQSGILSQDSAVYCMKQGELVNPIRDLQEEMDLIAIEARKNLQNPPTPGVPANPPAA